MPVHTQPIAPPRRFPFVTNYRAMMLLTTAACILAVDFPVYPRRFAKVDSMIRISEIK